MGDLLAKVPACTPMQHQTKLLIYKNPSQAYWNGFLRLLIYRQKSYKSLSLM